MGYYSDFDITARSYRYDHSLPQNDWDILLERLEILQDRLDMLRAEPNRYEDRICLTESDLRAILPEQLRTVYHLQKAIELAKMDLRERYGICTEQAILEEDPIVDEVTPLQLSIYEWHPTAA